ncbi:MAG: hypothetical protein ACRC3I_00745 [Cetobacterium sp.]
MKKNIILVLILIVGALYLKDVGVITYSNQTIHFNCGLLKLKDVYIFILNVAASKLF